MSKRTTPSKRSRKASASAHSGVHQLHSRRTDAGPAGLAKVLTDAIDNDPFEIIGYASIAAASMQSDVGELFDELAEQSRRLGPTLWATVAALPFVDGFARTEPVASKLLPIWLRQIGDTRITGARRRTENRQRDRSTYLVEVTMVPRLVTTCVFDLKHGRSVEIVGFHTVAAPITDVADFYEEKHRRKCRQEYEPVSIPEMCQNLLLALDASLCAGAPSRANRPPWPQNLPAAALVIDLAMGQIQPAEVPPYVALRRTTGGASSAAAKLRRSLTIWPAVAASI